MMKERTNPKSVAPHKVKGTVLFTVVCVMMVLIVFLMGALALATTANKRAMKNYNEAQTQATARAGVHALMSAIQNDVNAAKAASELDGKTDKTTAIEFKEGDIVFESNMTWDAVQKKYVGSNAGALGKITSAEIRYVGHKYILSGEELKDKAVIKFSATAKQGDAESTYAVYMLRDIVDDDGSGGGGGGGGFVSVGQAGAGNHTCAFGGTYIGFNEEKNDKGEVIGYPQTDFVLGNPGTIETPLNVNGNFACGGGAGKVLLVFRKPGDGATIWGNLLLNNDSNTFGTVTVNAGPAELSGKSYKDIPYIYVDKTFVLGKNQDGKLGEENMPLNIYCGNFQQGTNPIDIYADIYCMDADKTSYVYPKDNTDKLKKWTANVVHPCKSGSGDYNGGNFYSKGNLTIGTAGDGTELDYEGKIINAYGNCKWIIDGDLVVEGNLTLKNSAELTVNGELKVGGVLDAAGGTIKAAKSVLCNTVNGAGKIRDMSDKALTVQPLNANTERRVVDPAVQIKEYDCKYLGDQPGGKHYWVKQDGKTIVAETQKVINQDGKWVYESDRSHEVTFPKYKEYEKNGAVISEAEATVLVDKNTGLPVTAVPLYPMEFERTSLKGEASDKNLKVVNTVKDIMDTNVNPFDDKSLVTAPDASYSESISKNVIDGNTPSAGEAGWYEDTGTDLVIKKSCRMHGTLGKKVVFRPGENQIIWVVVDSALSINSGGQILLDDSAKGAELKIVNQKTISVDTSSHPDKIAIGVKSMIDDMKDTKLKAYEILTDASLSKASKYGKDECKTAQPIRLSIFSSEKQNDSSERPTFTVANNDSLIIANVRAPYMNYDNKSGCTTIDNYFTGKDLYYDGFDLKNTGTGVKGHNLSGNEAKQKNVGLIGCCIVNAFDSTNDWELLYVPQDITIKEKKKSDLEDALLVGWQNLYYENY